VTVKAAARAILACVLLAPALAGAENARLPYHALYRMQKVQAELSRAYTNLLVLLRMESVNPDVKYNNLDVYIDSNAGRIPIPIGAAGDFIVPMRESLLDEDPWIITNQPRGTMRLNWQVGLIVGHISTATHYSPLMRAVRDCDTVQEKMRQVFPDSPKLKMAGLKLTFSPPRAGQSVVIHARSSDKKLEADAKGELVLPLDPAWLEEDPLMTLSEEPAKVELISKKAGD